MTTLEALIADEAKRTAAILSAKWGVGFHDRGHGHGDYAVITVAGVLVVKCEKEIAEHIVALHNAAPEALA